MSPKFGEYVESDYNELEDREPFRTRILRKNVGFNDSEILYFDAALRDFTNQYLGET